MEPLPEPVDQVFAGTVPTVMFVDVVRSEFDVLVGFAVEPAICIVGEATTLEEGLHVEPSQLDGGVGFEVLVDLAGRSRLVAADDTMVVAFVQQ